MMEQILLTKKKILSFEDICPEWSDFLSTAKSLNIANVQAFVFEGTDHKAYTLVDCGQCIVGEAHGRKENYSHTGNDKYCDDCFHFAFSIFDVGNARGFEGWKNKFMQHFNEMHVGVRHG